MPPTFHRKPNWKQRLHSLFAGLLVGTILIGITVIGWNAYLYYQALG